MLRQQNGGEQSEKLTARMGWPGTISTMAAPPDFKTVGHLPAFSQSDKITLYQVGEVSFIFVLYNGLNGAPTIHMLKP